MKFARTKFLLVWLFAVPVVLTASAQEKGKAPEPAKKDTAALLKAAQAARPDVLKPYREIIPASAVTQKGFFSVHKTGDKYFFEIPDSLLSRDILVVGRVSKGSAEFRFLMGAYAGDQIGEKVIRFQKAPGNRMLLETVSYKERSADSSENGLYRSLSNNNLQSVQASFAIKAVNDSTHASVIEVTDFIGSDNAVLYYDPSLKMLAGIAAMAADRSFINDVKAFPMNIEVNVTRTYLSRPFPNGETRTYTLELNSSLVLLPETPMQPRFLDPRVGFFADEHTDFDANPQGVKKKSLIWRWRMEPREEDMEKYKRGELVIPKKQIVIYIDPLTPKKWVPYLAAGVNDWQAAFEQAGFKDAIVAREAPAGDSTWSLEDARHSVLVYKPSDIANAMGPSVKDPRSGEILETHINWYHNVMNVLYKWYFIQAGAIDKRAQAPQLPDELMGELIRFVSSHEVGHTLGLRHNWGASSTVPVDSLRNKHWVETHGHTPSIMDYARFNYVAQPEDNIGPKGIYPRIGAYDKWAIEWGYRYLPGVKNADEETPLLNKMVVNKLAAGKEYFFGIERVPNDSKTWYDPRNQNEDLGDDAMKAGAYGIKNLQRIENHLLQWTRVPNENYSRAGEMYVEIVKQFERYTGHVLNNIGGILTTPKTVEQQGPVYQLIPREKQRRAVQFLNEQLFATPEWLDDKELFMLTETDFAMVAAIQKKTLAALLDPKQLERLASQEELGGKDAYTAREFLGAVKKGIFSELPAHKPVDIYRRPLQRLYVEKLIAMLPPSPSANKDNDILPLVKAHAKQLSIEMKAAANSSTDAVTRSHWQDLYERLHHTLFPGRL